MNKKILFIIVIVCMGWLLSGCTPNNGSYSPENLAGFWWGFWHGIIGGINLIRSLFNSEVGIYEIFNNGFWYNFGFLLGVGGITASSGSTIKK